MIEQKEMDMIKGCIAKLKISDIDQYGSYHHQGVIINDVLYDNETKILTKYYELSFKVRLELKADKCI